MTSIAVDVDVNSDVEESAEDCAQAPLILQDKTAVSTRGGSLGKAVDPAREVKAELKRAIAREQEIRDEISLLEEQHEPWLDEYDALPNSERTALRNTYHARVALINRRKLWLLGQQRLQEELLAEIEEIFQGAP